MAMSRDPNLLHPELKKRMELLFDRYKRVYPHRPQPFLTGTYRTLEEQAELYAQGRTKPGQIVTWTKVSMHNFGMAFDVAFDDPRGAYACTECFEALGRLGEDVGLFWGGRWSPPDMPHFQSDNTVADIQSGHPPKFGKAKPLDMTGLGITDVYLVRLSGEEHLNVEIINRVGSKLFIKVS